MGIKKDINKINSKVAVPRRPLTGSEIGVCLKRGAFWRQKRNSLSKHSPLLLDGPLFLSC